MVVRFKLLSHPVVAHPVPGRFGLGHSLIAWARCVTWAHDHHIPCLAPSWRYLKIGPYLRRERDKRSYQSLFCFDDYIHGLQRARYLALTTAVPENEAIQPEWRAHKPSRVVFQNDWKNNTRFFPTLAGRHELIRDRLLRMSKPTNIPPVPKERWIGIHIRRGDYALLPKTAERRQLPLEWYLQMLRGIRDRLGFAAPARIYSDGTADELRPITSEPNVQLSSGHSALYDILELSYSAMIISSGSGFSMWGSYLQQVPRVSYPTQRIVRVIAARDIEREPEADSARAICPGLIEEVRNTLLHI